MSYLSIKKVSPLVIFVLLITGSGCVTNNQHTIDSFSSNPSLTDSVSKTKKPQLAPQISEPKAVKDLWQRLFSLYSLPEIINPRVQKEIDWYLKHPGYLKSVQSNAAPYLYFIVNEIEHRQLPGELALLPIIESAYKPFAYSHGSAAGLWQFIPSTGKYYGLKKNWWYDGRRDVYASTHAALTYFERLSKRFDNDWLLAIASYNAGGGTISSAIRKNKQKGLPSSYWDLKTSRETHFYVPKLLAIAHVLAHSEQYKITLQPLKNQPYFNKVDIQKQIDLSRAAELAEISLDQFYQLNPAFNQWATAPLGPHYLLLPSDKAALFSERLANLADKQRLKWTRHVIKPGETLGHIAQQYTTTVASIQQANDLSNNTIRAGKELLIPTARYKENIYSKSESMRKAAILRKPKLGQKHTHLVLSGDSFWSLSKKYGVSTRQLASWNSMAPGDTLRIGQKLYFWNKSSHRTLSSTDKNQTIRYTVRSGDSLYLLAQRFKVSINQLKRWNSLSKRYLQPGDKLKIIVDVTRS